VSATDEIRLPVDPEQRETLLEALYARQQRDQAREDAERLSGSLKQFIEAAFPVIKKDRPFRDGWHIDAVTAHLEAVSDGDINRLQVWLPPGMMKPVSVNALVLMATGERRRLGDVEVGDRVVTATGTSRTVTAVHEQGELPCVRVTTYSGRTVEAARDHPFLTADGWKNAGDLEPKDVLATVASPDCDDTRNDRPLEEMRLLGYFIGDGSCTFGYDTSGKPRSLASNITCFDDEQSADIVHCAEALGFAAAYHPAGRRWELTKGVKQWLRDVGVAGQSSHTKRVPEFVFSLSDQHIAHLVGAYFACDGTLAKRREGRSDLSVVFNSVNRELLSDIQHLLMRLGVKSRIRIHRATSSYKGKGHRSYRLVITSLDDAAKFVQRIPVIGEKARRLLEMGSRRTRFDETLQPDPVESVETVGLLECRCLTVEGDHTFTANDLVVRNSMSVHVFWPVWEWTRRPWLRYWCASHSLDLVWMHCGDSRTLLQSEWWMERWGEQFTLTQAGQRGYANDRGGTRTTTTPNSEGLGKHGDRIIIDDLLDASDAEATTRAVLQFTNDWYDTTISGRKEKGAAEVIVMQRLHELDPAAHALEVGDWTVLCLPERYEPAHPYAWRGPQMHTAVKQRLRGTPLSDGDPRAEDELLWPAHRDEQASHEYARRLGQFRAAGQLQQRPAAREGQLLKRDWWRFYDPRLRDGNQWERLPKFRNVIVSVDTPLKDKQTSDNVAIQCWGVRGADRYLLDLRLGKMNYSTAKRQVREMAQWAHRTWPHSHHTVLIENAGYGVELIIDLKREVTGVTKVNPGAEGNKVTRAESASDALESGNCFLPGYGPPWQPAYDEQRTPADVAAFIHNCALFPNAAHDDDVDSWSQVMNWLRGRPIRPARTASAVARR